ncbi:hypothetical protein B6P60_27435, partial [Escherichia coli]|nr:hypothetical protein [Escherichia coli]
LITIFLYFHGVLIHKKKHLKIINLGCGVFLDGLIFFQGVVWLLVLNKIKKVVLIRLFSFIMNDEMVVSLSGKEKEIILPCF